MTAFKPPSEWTPPDVFPTELLTNATQVAIDIETRDPNLKEKGPGFTRGDGEIVGISFACEGFEGYFPFAHDCRHYTKELIDYSMDSDVDVVNIMSLHNLYNSGL